MKFKLKTKSTTQGRYQISGSGKVLHKNTGKNHGMTKRSKQQIRDKRKQDVVSPSDSKTLLKKYIIYFKKLRKR